MHYHVIIIGAGPAGLFAAQAIADRSKKVLVLEKNAKAGKKLLLSGSGQCNFTHGGEITDFFIRYGEHGKFLKRSFQAFDNKACMEFFYRLGIASEVLPNGKVFPKSHSSQEVLDALLRRCQKNNVQIYFKEEVINIQMYDGLFAVETKNKCYLADNIVIATGGKSYPNTGSTGDGYEFAQKFEHTIITPRPALAPVICNHSLFQTLSGISFETAEATIWRENKKVISRHGNLLITHKGFSGPLILDASRWILPNDRLELNFLYPLTYEEIKKKFTKEISLAGKEEIGTYLRKLLLPKQFISVLCKELQIDEHMVCAKVSKIIRQKIVDFLTRCSFSIDQLGSFSIAMATCGGVHLKEINPTTMESRKQKGLYFIGEVIDIDGDTGGYNLQAAFSTAAICAKNIKK